MDVTPLVRPDAQIIQSYNGGGFSVSGTRYEGPILVSIDACTAWAGVEGSAFENLTLHDFQALIDRKDEIDVVLLGTGGRHHMTAPALRIDLKQAGLSVEVMETGAACRTYNVLMAEGRRVIAALLPV